MFVDDYKTKLGVLDTSIASMNVGDYIIMDSCSSQINQLFPLSQKPRFPTHERITRVGLKRQREVSMNLLCGTNCLNSNMILRRQWNVGFINSFLMSDVVTLGVGWCNYESTPNLYTKILLRKILSSEYMHSVRDSYTKRMLNSCGIDNVMNTSCPTMWGLTESHCAKIPSTKAKNVVFTLTDYRKDFEADKNLIIALKKSYDNVYFWVQGSGDYDYFLTFGDLINDINIIPATLNAYDDLLKSDLSIEFVGTRLHAGIRALQFGRRSKIIAVDNRAEEKRKDFNLPVMSRDYNLKSLLDSFNNNIELDLTIPFETINDWKSQF